GHENVVPAAETWLERIDGREISRRGQASDEGVAGGIEGDAAAEVRVAATQVRGVDPRAGRAQLGHKGRAAVDRTAAAVISALVGRAGHGKIARIGRAYHIRVARGVDGDAAGRVRLAPPEVDRVNQHRIDDQRPATIIRAQLKADFLVWLEHVAAG